VGPQRAKHIKSFALHIVVRKVYSKEKADASGGPAGAGQRHNTDPAGNPQPPERYWLLVAF
jgi:hypothetical protein